MITVHTQNFGDFIIRALLRVAMSPSFVKRLATFVVAVNVIVTGTMYKFFMGNEAAHDTAIQPHQQVKSTLGELMYPSILTKNITTATTPTTVAMATRSDSSCSIILENPADYHYELLESVALRYPLPWKELNCTSSSSGEEDEIVINVDIAHGQGGWSGEADGWRRYFFQYLQGKIRTRSADGRKIRFRSAYYWNGYKKYTQRTNITYNAYIGVSCDERRSGRYIRQSPNHFCVQHSAPKNNKYCGTVCKQRSCWLNPMHEPNCYFLPSDYPKFDDDGDNDNNKICYNYHNHHQQQPDNKNSTIGTVASSSLVQPSYTIDICVTGNGRRHDLLAKALQNLQSSSEEEASQGNINNTNANINNVRVLLLQRSDVLPIEYNESGVETLVHVLHKRDYLDYERTISNCDMLLPLVTPDSRITKGYFPPVGKLTGSIMQVIGYKLATIVHEDMYKVYGPYITGPALTFNSHDGDEYTSFEEALEKVLSILKERKMDEIRQCYSVSATTIKK